MSKSEMEGLREENTKLKNHASRLEARVKHLERQAQFTQALEEHDLVDEKYFSRRLRESVLAAQRYARFLCVVLVDTAEDLGDSTDELKLKTAARLREAFRKTDLVAHYESGQIYVLLEEVETGQAVQALHRIQDEIANIPAPSFSMACFPSDSNREEALLSILTKRQSELQAKNQAGPVVNTGDSILSLSAN